MASDASQVPLVSLEQAAEIMKGLIHTLDSAVRDLRSATAAKVQPKETWIRITTELTDRILSERFPVPQSNDWNVLAEKMRLVGPTAEIFCRVFTLVDDIYSNSSDLVKNVFTRLLDDCFVLDLWTEVDASPDVPSPSTLRERLQNSLVQVLIGAGNAVSHSETQESYTLLRQLGHEIIRVILSEFFALNDARWTHGNAC